MRYIIIAIILLLTSCSQRTFMAIKARHHYNRDSASVLRVRERNPSIIANEFKRMLANDELKQNVVMVHDTIVLPAKTITEYLKPEKIIDVKYAKFLKDSMVNEINKVAFAKNMSLDSANKKIFLILSSQKNCPPELNGTYVLTEGKTKRIARFENGQIKEITVFGGDTTISKHTEREIFIKGKDTVTNHTPKFYWWLLLIVFTIGVLSKMLLRLILKMIV